MLLVGLFVGVNLILLDDASEPILLASSGHKQNVDKQKSKVYTGGVQVCPSPYTPPV